MNRGVALALLAVVLCQGLLVALMFTPAPHTGGDNAAYVSLAHSLTEEGAYRELWTAGEPPHSKYPPVFPLLLGLPLLLGVKGWVGLKMVPVLCTLLAGVFTFLWVREREGVAPAAGVALLVALSDGVLDYSRWILSDPTFLALTVAGLWALERARGRRTGSAAPTAPREGWVVLGLAFVLMAYFTRSAGIPLVVAALLWLALERQWRAGGAFLAVFGILAALWWWRGRIPGEGAYASEFLLLDPYQPELGRVGVGDMLGRMGENAVAYVTRLIPEGVVGLEGPLLGVLGIGLVLLALVGWLRALWKDRGPAELFLPLYFGLLLLWPVVWSGDRFALPLLPLLFFYAATALFWILGPRKGALRTAVAGFAFLLLALPALKSWSVEVQSARQCAPLAREDPYACYGSTVQEYAALARWAGRNLPGGASVITRKPRIFFLLGGVKAQSLPFTTEAETFLEAARTLGSRYATLDRWDGLSRHYLGSVIRARPGVFCHVTGVAPHGEVGTQLLGILPGEGERAGRGEQVRLEPCPGAMTLSEARDLPSVPPGDIPLLVWGVRR
jgi:hypothetical protein